MVRHSEDYHPVRHATEGGVGKLWDGDIFSLAGRDPVLTENGIRAAADGFTESEAKSVFPGYKGVKGGIRGKVDLFQPTLVVASPLRRTLLTTVIACEHLSKSTPIIAHPDLREIKSEKSQRKTPDHVKPGAHGVPLSVLRETLSVTVRGPDVDLSLLMYRGGSISGSISGSSGSSSGSDNSGSGNSGNSGSGGSSGSWASGSGSGSGSTTSSSRSSDNSDSHGSGGSGGSGGSDIEVSWHEGETGETPKSSIARATRFLSWLKARKEQRVVIFTHGGVLKLPIFGSTRFLHGECRRYTFDGEQMILDKTYEIGQHAIPQEQRSLLKAKDIFVAPHIETLTKVNTVVKSETETKDDL